MSIVIHEFNLPDRVGRVSKLHIIERREPKFAATRFVLSGTHDNGEIVAVDWIITNEQMMHANFDLIESTLVSALKKMERFE
jgi:hypothetical protein